MVSWVGTASRGDFSLNCFPYGVFSTEQLPPRIGVAVGPYVFDLTSFAQQGLLPQYGIDWTKIDFSSLNDYAALPKATHASIRSFISELFDQGTTNGPLLRDNPDRRQRLLIPQQDVRMHLPMRIGDYTDFFVGINHARNCSELLRGDPTLAPNYTQQPIGYHGRASSIVVSGTDVRRPTGQFLQDGQTTTTFEPTRKMDFEVEFAAFIGTGNALGEPIKIGDANEHIFGYVILNDWSSRDIQRHESWPLGPFNGKNYCTTISPWVVPAEALNPYLVQPLPTGEESQILPHLKERVSRTVHNISIDVSVTRCSQTYHLSTCNTKDVIFSFAQMIAHHTAGGCPLRTGDLIATGTLSGETVESWGSLLEITQDGGVARTMYDGVHGEHIEMGWLQDGDVVQFRAYVDGEQGRIGFGTCEGKVVPAYSSVRPLR